MGAAVFSVIEYREYEAFWSFGQIDLPYEVEFLCAIAWGNGGLTDEMPHPPRSAFPTDASYDARKRFFVSAEEIAEFLKVSGQANDGESSLKEYAAQYGEWAVKEYEASGLLPPPELTELGWLTLSELEANLAQRGVKSKSFSPPTRAMLAAMNELAVSYGRDGVRILFWFGM